jgi:prepilin-type N-terminal cleavage/methylation domain-containing protein
MRARVREMVRDERGFTLVELVVTMAILGIVLGGLTATYASATRAQADLTRRFEAQEHGRLALDKVRRDAHCADSATVNGANTLVTFTLPAGCPTGSGSVTWCVRAGTYSTELYRIASAAGTCSGGSRWAEYIDTTDTTVKIFELRPLAAGELQKVRVTFPVDLTAGTASGRYSLQDDIALRNTTRT